MLILAAMTRRQLKAELAASIAHAVELDASILAGKSGRRLRPVIVRRIERLRAELASRQPSLS
jgi:hypothetical protein